MKQFWNVFRFEYNTIAKNKIFIGLTVLVVVLIGGYLSFPRISEHLFDTDTDVQTTQQDAVIVVQDNVSRSVTQTTAENASENEEQLGEQLGEQLAEDSGLLLFLSDVIPDRAFEWAEPGASEEDLREAVLQETYVGAIILESALEFTYIVRNLTLTDMTPHVIAEAVLTNYRAKAMQRGGMSQDEVVAVLSAVVESNVEQLGVDQMQTFFYTYILLFMLYMAIMMYGQSVATGVATEKGSRAMEVLITSASPVHLMFGKVVGAGMAGLTQIVSIVGSGFLFFRLNAAYHEENMIVSSIFDMPLSILLYITLFFVLGFFIYAFLYGALGSLASRTEDVNALIMPVTFVFVAAFVVVMTFLGSGNVDAPLMRVLSFVPFTAPMAMFVRIAMGEAATIEIVISVVVLIASTIGIGYLAAAIYRMGVLLYGKPPKPNEIIKLLRAQKKA